MLKVCLCSLVMLALLIGVYMSASADVAICTIVYPFGTDVEVVSTIANTIQGAVDVQLFGEDDMDGLATWVADHTSSQNNILVVTGILPTSIYASGNAEPDGSLVEEFLDAGNTIISTGEYFGFVIEGGDEANGEAAFGEILDLVEIQGVYTDWDGWDDPKILTPTADGEKYTPSVEEYDTCYAMHIVDFEGTPWELDIAVTDNDELAGDFRFDGVMVNTETGGRFGAFVQAAWCGEITAWRGDVIGEYILNYHLAELTTAVQSYGKMASAWGEIKGF